MSNARFLTLDDVADELNTSLSQAYALVRSGDLVGIQIGGRGQWRVERVQFEAYIGRMYEQTTRTLESDDLAELEGHGLSDSTMDPDPPGTLEV